MRRKRADLPRNGWVIWDGWRECPYIQRGWSTEAEARRELADLLRGYPASSLWRDVLTVREIP